MARKPRLKSVAAASTVPAVSSAASAAPDAALPPASPAAPTRAPRLALLGPRPLIDGEDETNYDVILERISGDVAPAISWKRSGCAMSSTWCGTASGCAA
jgi:hypothetical protein